MRARALLLALLPLGVLLQGCCQHASRPAPETAEPTSTAATTPPNTPPPPAQTRRLADSQRLVAPSGKAWITVLALGQEAFVGLIELAPDVAIPDHQDTTEETIHVIEGTGVLTMDGQAHELAPGTTVFMPAGATVSYRNGPTRMVGIQVFAGPEPASKYAGWTPTSQPSATVSAPGEFPLAPDDYATRLERLERKVEELLRKMGERHPEDGKGELFD